MVDSFEEQMEKICGRGDKLNANFHEQSTELHQGIIQSFSKKAEALILEGSDWGD